MLLIVLLLVDDNVAVDQQIVEQEELPGFRFLPASFGENPFSNQDTSCNTIQGSQVVKAEHYRRY